MKLILMFNLEIYLRNPEDFSFFIYMQKVNTLMKCSATRLSLKCSLSFKLRQNMHIAVIEHLIYLAQLHMSIVPDIHRYVYLCAKVILIVCIALLLDMSLKLL